jgi:hypothetical protein
MSPWWGLLMFVVLYYATKWYYNHPGDKKHREPEHDFGVWPRGTVWFYDGIWWTMPRHSWQQPRKFNERSNPLDHEFEWEIVPVPRDYRKIPHEVEY